MKRKTTAFSNSWASKKYALDFKWTINTESKILLRFVKQKFELSELRNQMSELDAHTKNKRDRFTQTLKYNCFMFDKSNQTSLKMFDIYTQTNETQVFKSSCAIQCQILTESSADSFTQTDNCVPNIQVTTAFEATNVKAKIVKTPSTGILMTSNTSSDANPNYAKAQENFNAKNDIDKLLKRSFHNYTNRKTNKNDAGDDQGSMSNKRVRFSDTDHIFEINEIDDDIDYVCLNENF
jgi:hypothetical protein